MRTYLLAAAALVLVAGAGCHNLKRAKGGCDTCGPCSNGGNGAYADGLGHGGHGHGAFAGGGHGAAGHFGSGPAGHYPGGKYGPHGGAHGTPGFPHHHHFDREYVGPQGPPTAQVAYPYYTIRGPRDFLMDNPPSIGR